MHPCSTAVPWARGSTHTSPPPPPHLHPHPHPGKLTPPACPLSALRSECDLRSLPPQLASLGPTLRDLNLRSNWSLGRQGPAGFHPLQWLVGLTRLVLGHLPLVQLPPQLSALSVLEHLVSKGGRFM